VVAVRLLQFVGYEVILPRICRFQVGGAMRFGVLGPLLVEDGTGDARPVAGARQRTWLGALLVRANRTVPNGELAEIVWDGAPPAGAAALRTQVMRLRRSLGGEPAARIVTRGLGYAITLDVEELDATLFEVLYRDAGAAVRAERWREAADVTGRALGLWRGDALADVDSRVLREECAGRLEQLRVQAAEWRAEAGMHLGRHEELVPELRDLAQRHPLREHVHGQLMLALYRCGRQAEALNTYQDARRVLVKELGVEPGAPLQKLYRQILAADPALSVSEPGPDDGKRADAADRRPAVVPRQLPAPVPHFTGRAGPLKTLTDLAGQAAEGRGAVVISAIDGMPGVGKTALAVQAGHLVAGRFPDGQLYVDLHGHTPGRPPVDPAEALAALLAADGVDPRYLPADLDGRTAMWRGRLANQRVLLIFDNATSSAQVAPLLPGTAGCLVLVTSRRFLGDLPAAAQVPLDVLPSGDARAMFTDLAPRAAAEPAAVSELVALCGHLPLAISLLARLFTRHRSWTMTDLIAETRARLLTVTAENRTVAAAFEASYQDLDTERQRFFHHLGLHPGPDIDIYAAAALAGLPPGETATHLDALHGDRLLEEPVPRRYRMHDLIRRYARVLAAGGDTGDREQAVGRLLDYFQHTAEAAVAGAGGARPEQDGTRAWMTAEHANLVACIGYAATRREPARVVGLTAAIAAHLRSDGPWPQAITLHAAAAQAAQRLGDQPGHANALLNLGDVKHLASDYPGAIIALERALDIFREIGDQAGEATALRILGQVRQQSGLDVRGASIALERALDIFREIGDQAGEANALRTLGAVRRVAGDYPVATGLLEQALGMFRGLGDRLGEASALLNLGSTRQTTGDYPGATIVMEQALGISRDIGDRIGEAYAQFSLGGVRRLIGDYPGAIIALEQAINISRAIGSRIGEAYALQYLGEVRRLTGDHPGASIALQRSLDICRAVGDRIGEAYALLNLGAARRAAGDYRGATGPLEEALGIYRIIDHRDGEAEAHIEIGAVHVALGAPAQALACYERALELARSAGTQLEEARALEGIGRCAAQLSDVGAADSALRQALDIYQRLGAADATRLAAEMQALPGGALGTSQAAIQVS
jgi:DNA-binding SARP family transcriptional activator/tetratricopeptide (TPR) repeat protein